MSNFACDSFRTHLSSNRWTNYLIICSAALIMIKYLYNGRVLCYRSLLQWCSFWWLTDMQIFYVAATKDDVFKDLISRRYRVIGWSILRSKWPYCNSNFPSNSQLQSQKHVCQSNIDSNRLDSVIQKVISWQKNLHVSHLCSMVKLY